MCQRLFKAGRINDALNTAMYKTSSGMYGVTTTGTTQAHHWSSRTEEICLGARFLVRFFHRSLQVLDPVLELLVLCF